MKYAGGKGGTGVYQTVINNIPPHRVYIESHLGGGNVFEKKRPASVNIGIDLDPEVIAGWRLLDVPGLELHNADAAEWLEAYPFDGSEFVYADPPYVRGSRRSLRPIYRREYTDADHRRLLYVLARLPCPVMLSGYASDLYAQSPVGSWRQEEFNAPTRAGWAVETLWMNYPRPAALHDSQYLGDTFRDRERIKRKKTRWAARLARLDPLERAAILECLRDLEGQEPPGHGLSRGLMMSGS